MRVVQFCPANVVNVGMKTILPSRNVYPRGREFQACPSGMCTAPENSGGMGSPAGLKTRQNPGNPTSWGCHQGAISDPDEVPMGLETAVLHRNGHVWYPDGSGQALGHNPCLYIFLIPAGGGLWGGVPHL
eukprot:gene23405-biopygen13369